MKRFLATLCGLLLSLPCTAQKHAPSEAATKWVGSWATSAQAPDPQNNQVGTDPSLLVDATIRQIVHLSLGGDSLRLHLSNEFGTKPLTIDSVQIAKAVSPSSSAIDPATNRAVTFDGRTSVTIPAGARYLSDPVQFAAAPLSDVTISFHLAAPPAGQTWHPGSRATSYFVHGQHTADADLENPEKAEHWYQISAVDVAAPEGAGAVAILGDSITDGHGSTTNQNDRWTDILARRLSASAATREISVLNEGIGGNHLLTDGLGVNALARMDRDVLAQSGVRYVFVLEGINDLGMLARAKTSTAEEHAALVRNMIAAYEQIVLRAHAHGLKVIGATLTPFVGGDYYHPTDANETDRQQVNAWIRTTGHFDAMVDFDAVVRDPANPSRMLPAADSGDHLHPGPAGYKMMGDTIPLGLFH
jgi:lysophospholipase L1-like esterase